MNYDFLQCEIENNIGVVTINRPPLNPLNTAVFNELGSLMSELDMDPEVKVVIITGSGEKAFVAGADLHQMMNLTHVGMMEMNKISRNVFSQIENISKPVIAAINGLALGGGLELALVCDFRISSEKAKFAFPEVGLGIIPGGGGTQRLQRIVGQGVAKELLYFGEMFNADKALDINLVHKVVRADEVLQTAKEWAGRLAEKPVMALRMIKTAVNTGANVDIESGLTIESACFSNAFATEDRKEGMQAFVEKRKPVYTGQ